MLSTINLEEICVVRTPLIFRDKSPVDVADGNARVFSIKDLVAWRPDAFNELVKVDVADEKLYEAVQVDDILMPGRGTSYPARLFKGSDLPLFPAGQVHIIRLTTDQVDPAYLTWYLNRPETQEAIRATLTGATIQALNKSQLVKLQIVIPSMITQKRIAAASYLAEQRANLRVKLNSLEQEEMQAVCRAALENDTKYA